MAYKRVLLKLSGEVFAGGKDGGIDRSTVEKLLTELQEAIVDTGAEVAVVIGGGNIMRARSDNGQSFSRVAADSMGMAATVINGIAMLDVAEKLGVKASLFSRLDVPKVAKLYTVACARQKLVKGSLVILAGGTGNPYVTTDTASVLSALELECEAVLKATKVDGVYDKDPAAHQDAKKLGQLSFSEAAANPDITVMDDTAFVMAQEHKMPIVVFNSSVAGNIKKVITGEQIGTTISA